MRGTAVLLLIALLLPSSVCLGLDEPEIVSLVELLGSPKQFDGHKVRVMGFLAFEEESAMLYLHREDYEHDLVKNGIALRYGRGCRHLNLVYVILDGTFVSSPDPHRDIHTGFLEDISKCRIWGKHS